MPCETDLPDWRGRPAPLSCTELCALMDCCGDGACFQVDWLEDLHRDPAPRPEMQRQPRPR